MKTIQEQFEEYCRKGNIEEVDKILKEKEFIDNSSINYHYSTGIYQASDYNQLDMIKYLLAHPNYQNQIAINFENNCILKTACRQNYFDIINYLILEYQMKLTIDVLMPNYENANYVMDLYQKRSLNNKLERSLPEKKMKPKGLKI